MLAVEAAVRPPFGVAEGLPLRLRGSKCHCTERERECSSQQGSGQTDKTVHMHTPLVLEAHRGVPQSCAALRTPCSNTCPNRQRSRIRQRQCASQGDMAVHDDLFASQLRPRNVGTESGRRKAAWQERM